VTSDWYPISAMRRLRKAVRVRWGWVEAVLMERARAVEDVREERSTRAFKGGSAG
jgi:hypothetical protein